MNEQVFEFLKEHSNVLKKVDLSGVMFFKAKLNHQCFLVHEIDVKNPTKGRIVAYDIALTQNGHSDRPLAMLDYMKHEKEDVMLFNSPKLLSLGNVEEGIEEFVLRHFEKISFEKNCKTLLGNLIFNDISLTAQQVQWYENAGYKVEEQKDGEETQYKLSKTLTQERYDEIEKTIEKTASYTQYNAIVETEGKKPIKPLE